MNPILEDFKADLGRLRKIVRLAEAADALGACALNEDAIQDQRLKDAVRVLHTANQQSHAEMPILNGVLLLYLAGRFENYVRELLEDLSDTVADKCGIYSRLPKEMRASLISLTAEVIASPRKYGHAENGVRSFVSTLADNLDGKPLSAINSECLSITSENMWPDTLSEIFLRIGATRIWERLGQQAALQLFFQVDQPEKATREARDLLSKFMTLRNQIAHPSGNLAWPRIGETVRFIDYCEVVGQALAELCPVFASTLGNRPDEGAAAAEAPVLLPVVAVQG